MTDVAADQVQHPVQRSRLQHALAEAEERTLRELELVRRPLQRGVVAAISADCSLADAVAAEDAEFDRRYGEVHDQVLALIAQQAPVAGDLRLAMALLHVNDRVERIGAQCLNIATLCGALPTGAQPSPEQLRCLSEMSALADEQLRDAAEIFEERDLDGAARLRERDAAINELNRECFALAIKYGDEKRRREAAFFVAMMARAIERIGDNAVEIGQQTSFVVTGRLRPVPASSGSV
jgi:phosphate transport system protein